MPAQLTALFDSYRNSWDAFSGERVASHYRLPATILDMDGLQTYTNTSDLNEKFAANCQMYRELGYTRAAYSVGDCIPNGETAATVDLGWRVTLAEDILDFRTTYFCAVIAQQWRIVSAVVYAGPYLASNAESAEETR